MNFGTFLNRNNKLKGPLTDGKFQYSGYYLDSFRRLKKNKVAMICLTIIIILVISAVFAPLIVRHDPNKQVLENSFAKISQEHVFGTDEYGRDIFSRIVYGTRISLSVGVIAQIIATVIGVILGAVAGYYGGVIDDIISRLIEIMSAFPSLLFALGIMFALGQNIMNVFIAIGLVAWTGIARLIRGQVMQLKQKEYVEACISSGGTSFQIIMKHLIPNCLPTIIVVMTMGIPDAILAESGLSFLGLGVQPPTPSWGSMISVAQPYIRTYPFYSIVPGIAIIITVIAMNLFGDALRDALDPRLKN